MIFDNGSEFKLHFQELCASYGLEQKPTSARNPQANAILERLHAVIDDMLRTSKLDKAATLNDKMIESFIANVAWAVQSTHHTFLKSLPGAAIFGPNMLFNLPHIADWTAIRQR